MNKQMKTNQDTDFITLNENDLEQQHGGVVVGGCRRPKSPLEKFLEKLLK